ncbi:MAG TPA: hypothetical protein VKG68_01680 [Candidatus Binatus sp.]|nr:hypothetical protein [Candidatus Binatus sp.]
MSNPLGRFEFRVWGNHLGPFRDRLAAIAPPSEPHESAETYILSRATDAANLKIRAGSIDLKLMFEQVGRLERWRPVLESEFPLDSRTIVEQIFSNLGVAIPHIVQPSYTHGEFIRDLVRPHRDLATVDVVKLRRQFISEKYTAEFAEVGIAGGATSETIEIESDDPAAVLRAIAKLGLNSQANINYVRHLKLMTGMGPRDGASPG